jgi:non-ribosomal peptide synthetase-like protein
MFVSHHEEAPEVEHEQWSDGQALSMALQANVGCLASRGTIGERAATPCVSRCAHRLFEAQADERPTSTAIVFENQSWTYAEVEARANQLARFLRAGGVRPGSTVAVYCDRSEKPVISIVAILKAGAAYVPIDPGYPPERVRHIVSEANAAALVTESAHLDVATSVFVGRTIDLDTEAEAIASESTDRLLEDEVGVLPDNLAYILFTSGTTGRPKGVMIEHRNVVGFITGWNQITQIGPHDRIYHGFSLGFDASVEELWMAFSNGAALVIASSAVVRVPDEVAGLVRREKITVISLVPTFLSILNPELPSLRIVISGGEPCPPEVIRRWSRPERRFFNTYGPTETTVDATYIECSVDRPVTIGHPLPGYEAFVLDENLRQLPPGEAGELCIGGVAVARGYLNQPELTAKRFVANPFYNAGGSGSRSSRRLYRSGDLVRINADGEIEFLGRIDRQVKVRGFRIELSEIESVMHEHPQIQQAVVEVVDRQGMKEIAAFVVPYAHVNGSFDRVSVLEALRKRLPSYMVPGYLDLIDEVPTLPSGKADRARLPEPCTPLVSNSQNIVPPSSELERAIAGVWQTLFKLPSVSCADDFFLDLGGHSLLAAEMVSQLRSEHGLEVAIRDVYQHPTVQKLATHISAARRDGEPAAPSEPQPKPSSRAAIESVPRLTRWTVYGMQALSLAVGYGLVTAPFLVFVLLVLGVIQGTTSVTTLIIFTVMMSLLVLPLSVTIAIVLKWLIVRRYQPGAYPLWSFYYFRWWLATRVQAVSGMALFEGTPLMNLFYRLMGAKVGKHCVIDTSLCAIYDLVTIGDDTCIGARTQLLGYRVESGMLIIGEIEIGSRCFVGSHSAIGVNTKIGDDAALDDQSYLPDGASIPAGQSYRGSPAEPGEVSLPPVDERAAINRWPLLYGTLYFLASEIVGDVLLLTLLPPLLVLAAAYLNFGIAGAIIAVYVSLPLNLAAFCLISAGIKALVMWRTRPGIYPVESLYAVRKWVLDVVLRVSGRVMYPIYATVYLSPWLRLLGAKVGRRAEVAMVGLMTPDLIDLGDHSFIADGSTIGGRRYYRGHLEIGANRIGRKTFVGNSSLLPTGTSIGDHSLLGVMSRAPGPAGSAVPDGTEWLGSPPFQLPCRKAAQGFDVSQTYEPTLKLYVLRCLIDAVRIVFPYYIGLTGLVLFVAFMVFGLIYLPAWSMFLLLPLVSTLLAFAAALTVVLVKKLLIGTFHPIVKPLWSVYVWLNEVVNGAFETIGAPVLAPMMGTPFFSWYLRMFGCRVGKHAFIQTTYFSEFDLVDIGDYVALNYGVVVQNHLFEDRIMKSSYLKIGDECSVGNMSVILYDTEMKRGAVIDSLSLLMKGETLPPDTRWIGIPTQQIKGPAGRAVEQSGPQHVKPPDAARELPIYREAGRPMVDTMRFDRFDTIKI